MIKKFRNLTHRAREDRKKFNGNPMNIFLLIKQLTHDMDTLLDSYVSAPLNNDSWNLEGKS
jgi:hypothetical protein